jgi:hypothetical protein
MVELFEFFLSCLYLYIAIGSIFAVGHCFLILIAMNIGTSEYADELTFTEIIEQVITWIVEWPMVLRSLLMYKNDK